MDCTRCTTKQCQNLTECTSLKVDAVGIASEYLSDDNQKIVQSAAKLVDNGRGGTLGRIEELAEFCTHMNFKKVGIAYCWGLENLATQLATYLREQGLRAIPVRCTTGGISQAETNSTSTIKSVSCNPLTQAEQLNTEHVDIAVTLGLCMGHDILFQQQCKAPVTNILVKDRVYNHAPFDFFNK
ncbi:MAG: DUF1847 domain-containing protein [Bacteroidota bacterium]